MVVGLVTLAVLATSLPATPARGTLVRGFGLAGLAREAHVIVRGEVIHQESRWSQAWEKIGPADGDGR